MHLCVCVWFIGCNYRKVELLLSLPKTLHNYAHTRRLLIHFNSQVDFNEANISYYLVRFIIKCKCARSLSSIRVQSFKSFSVSAVEINYKVLSTGTNDEIILCTATINQC
jgi:hypothetical protein